MRLNPQRYTNPDANLSHFYWHIPKAWAYEKQKGICIRCSKSFELKEMEADHITPWSKGGKTNEENCQMLCMPCNRRKSSN